MGETRARSTTISSSSRVEGSAQCRSSYSWRTGRWQASPASCSIRTSKVRCFWREAAFRDNSIGMDVVRELNENDLEKLGLPLGDRKRVLKAIANLPTPGAAVASPVAAPHARDEAERRPITVMFCDLVGSTSLASTLDAEDWRDLVGAYLDDAAKAIGQYGGHVAKKLGDGLMALFGYPRAQENDAERAARAGLTLLRALEDLNAANAGRGLPALTARIGLDSGAVVVDSTGEVFGDAPNLAARAQSAAEPGTMLVMAAVQGQVAGLFVVEDKGPRELKGVPGSPVLYRIVRPSGGGRRAGARTQTPLVGREDDLSLLIKRWGAQEPATGNSFRSSASPALASRASWMSFGPARRDAPFLDRMGLIATVAEHYAPSVGRMGKATVWRRRGHAGIAACRP
jgi:class 3 adenylate cyclase